MSENQKGRKSELTATADVLQSLLQNSKSPLTEQFIRWKVWKAWPEVVGEEISRSTLPVGNLKGTLYIWEQCGALARADFYARALTKSNQSVFRFKMGEVDSIDA